MQLVWEDCDGDGRFYARLCVNEKLLPRNSPQTEKKATDRVPPANGTLRSRAG
jgi:hypothetical protein